MTDPAPLTGSDVSRAADRLLEREQLRRDGEPLTADRPALTPADGYAI